jgi:hypothetical protein
LAAAPEQKSAEGSSRLSLARGAVLRRGARDDGARGLDGAKVAVAAARQTVAASGVRPDRIVLLTDRAVDAEVASPWLGDLVLSKSASPVPSLGFSTISSVIQALTDAAAVPGATAIVIVGESVPPAMHDHEAFARALLAHDPTMERRIAGELLGNVGAGKIPTPAPSAGEQLVVEERPGKAVVLDIDNTTHKRLSKRWQALTSGKERRSDGVAPLMAPTGWGVGAIIVAPEGGVAAKSAKAPKVEVSHRSWPMLGGFYERSAAADAVAATAAWIASTGDAVPKHLYVISPSYAHAAALTAEARKIWGSAVTASYPDLASGWHPGLSLVDALLHGQRPTLVLGLGTWPTFHGVWLR